jgi:hypothetical protein
MSTTHPEVPGLVSEIAATRQEMGQAIYLLADRIAPKKVIARAKENARIAVTHKVEDIKDRLNPVQIVRRKLGLRQGVIEARSRESSRVLAPVRAALNR